MGGIINRRRFVLGAAAAGAAVPQRLSGRAPAVLRSRAARPVVISDRSGIAFKNGGPVCCVEKAFTLITSGSDVLDALIAGVNIPELDPEKTGIPIGNL